MELPNYTLRRNDLLSPLSLQVVDHLEPALYIEGRPIVSIVVPFLVNENLYYRIPTTKLVN